jgi:hypothetical protein
MRTTNPTAPLCTIVHNCARNHQSLHPSSHPSPTQTSGAMPSLARNDIPSPDRLQTEGRHAGCSKARQTLPMRAKPCQRAPQSPRAQNEPRPQRRSRGRLPATSSVESRRRASRNSPPPSRKCAKSPNEPTAPVTPPPSLLRALRVLRGSILPVLRKTNPLPALTPHPPRAL